MNQITFSNGPWALVKEDNSINKTIEANDGRTIAVVVESDTPEKVWGNGFLLANASLLYQASVALREAQKAYMEDRGNDQKGQEVAKCAKELDMVLERIDSGEYQTE